MNTLSYKMIEEALNDDAQIILQLIKDDYYQYMSPEVKKTLDDLIAKKHIVKVNRGVCSSDEKTFAHGGRALKDGLIHFYPDSRNIQSTSEAIIKCKNILVHEVFHYFIQPDNINLSNVRDEEMANFYTEGLVEKFSRYFAQKHSNLVTYEKANYGFNINFVDTIKKDIGGDGLEVIFSKKDYLYKVGQYWNQYALIKKRQRLLLDLVDVTMQYLPKQDRGNVSDSFKRAILQEGYSSYTRTTILPRLQKIFDRSERTDTSFEHE